MDILLLFFSGWCGFVGRDRQKKRYGSRNIISKIWSTSQIGNFMHNLSMSSQMTTDLVLGNPRKY